MKKVATEAEKTMKKLCGQIGNIVADACPVAMDEVRPALPLVVRGWQGSSD